MSSGWQVSSTFEVTVRGRLLQHVTVGVVRVEAAQLTRDAPRQCAPAGQSADRAYGVEMVATDTPGRNMVTEPSSRSMLTRYRPRFAAPMVARCTGASSPTEPGTEWRHHGGDRLARTPHSHAARRTGEAGICSRSAASWVRHRVRRVQARSVS